MTEYRFAGPEDLSAALAIRLRMLKIVNRLPEDHRFDREFLKQTEVYLSSGQQKTVLAMRGRQVIGCATLSYIDVMPTFDHPTGHRAHLMNVFTEPDCRRQGIARHMVELLIMQAKERGVTEISLDATESGRPLYEATGFRASQECMVLNMADISL